MANLKQARNNPEHQLFDEIDAIHAGMLGLEGTGIFRPMAPELDRAARTIWFFTRKDSDLVKAAAQASASTTFIVIGANHDYHASLSGTLDMRLDPEIRDRYWNSVIEAWFDGKDDPEMTMLALKLVRGQVWISTSSALKFGWEIAKAQLNESDPDVGMTVSLTF